MLLKSTACSATFVSLLFSFSAMAIEPTTNIPSTSGATPQAGATMNDHDKMVEACNGMHGKDKCDQMMKSCTGDKDKHQDPEQCMHKQMKKHH